MSKNIFKSVRYNLEMDPEILSNYDESGLSHCCRPALSMGIGSSKNDNDDGFKSLIDKFVNNYECDYNKKRGTDRRIFTGNISLSVELIDDFNIDEFVMTAMYFDNNVGLTGGDYLLIKSSGNKDDELSNFVITTTDKAAGTGKRLGIGTYPLYRIDDDNKNILDLSEFVYTNNGIINVPRLVILVLFRYSKNIFTMSNVDTSGLKDNDIIATEFYIDLPKLDIFKHKFTSRLAIGTFNEFVII